eukprot:CAMPEP_0117500706 /NCGR_PEP_ID=MMETSP0784-20121206/22913_1 /TAXON_ID=39447 /ORGANISM="" /LENGTH=125 /DNA_ID=CAMNT_0005295921 /DNA_START=163 /DNA_END=541 /DNA_ORIENTATION=+
MDKTMLRTLSVSSVGCTRPKNIGLRTQVAVSTPIYTHSRRARSFATLSSTRPSTAPWASISSFGQRDGRADRDTRRSWSSCDSNSRGSSVVSMAPPTTDLSKFRSQITSSDLALQQHPDSTWMLF